MRQTVTRRYAYRRRPAWWPWLLVAGEAALLGATAAVLCADVAMMHWCWGG